MCLPLGFELILLDVALVVLTVNPHFDRRAALFAWVGRAIGFALSNWRRVRGDRTQCL